MDKKNSAQKKHGHPQALRVLIGTVILVSVTIAMVVTLLITRQIVEEPLQDEIKTLTITNKILNAHLGDLEQSLKEQEQKIQGLREDLYVAAGDTANALAIAASLRKTMEDQENKILERLLVLEKKHENVCETLQITQDALDKIERQIEGQKKEIREQSRQWKNAISNLQRRFDDLDKRTSLK